MQALLLSTLLFFTTSNLFSQEVRQYEDFYQSGQIYVRGFNIPVDSTSSADTGLWTYWYENGAKLSEEIRNDPFLTKYINCWTADGQQICINGMGKFYQTWTDFIQDSTIYTITDSIKQGQYISYLPSKKGYWKVAEGNYVNGLRQGWVTFYSNKDHIQTKQEYVDDKPNGLQKEFYRNGTLKQQGYQKEDIKDSIWSFYDNKGVLKKNVTFQKNRQVYLTEFYQNGKVKTEGSFKQIKVVPKKIKVKEKFPEKRKLTKRATRSSSLTVKNGVWLYYNTKGQLVKKEEYLKGELIKNGM